MQQVFLVMANDFPDAAFDSRAGAEAYCQQKRGEHRLKGFPVVHWNMYELPVRKSKEEE